MASPYTPQCSLVVATGSLTFTTLMGSVYMTNNGPSNVVFYFDAGLGGTYTMVPNDIVNLENISYTVINFTFAGASSVSVAALPRGS